MKDGEYSDVGANPSCPNCARLNARVAELEAAVAVIPTLRALLEQAQKKMRDLEERLGQDSRNSHKPPSQDPPGSRKRPEKKPSERKPGGQLGHQGKNRDLLPPEEVDQFVVYTPPACDHCHHDFPAVVPVGLPVLRHQVVDLPDKAYTVIEHRVYAMACDACGHVSHGELPKEVACSSFGPKLTAMVSFLTGACQTSRRLVEEIIEDVLGIPIALGTITNMEAEVTQALEAPYQEAAGAAREAGAKNLDETSWKDQNKNVWLWTLATASVAFFVIHRNRGIRGLKALVGGVLRGVFTSDRWGAYRIRALRWRQVCWAHLVRDFQKLIDRGGAAVGIGQRAKELAGELFMVWRDFKEGGIDRATLRVTLAPIRMELRTLLEEGTSTLLTLDEKAATFCQNLLDLEPALWAFLRYEGVEPTNNHAERVLRRGVLWRKRSFGSRSERGLRFAERILTVVQTRRLQRQRVFPFLVQAVTARRAGKPAPSLLPA